MAKEHRLLIVDDELSNLQKLQRTFMQEFHILQAQSGKDALTLLRQDEIDVIITDQRMPGLSGVELLKESLKLRPEALRVVLTGYTEVDYLMDAINRGQAHRYITKPWEPFALKQTVLQDLEHLQLKRANRLLQEQLRIAKEVQSHLFPKVLPGLSGLEYAGECRPAGQVGGDYYDFLKLSENELCVAVGDISGKGISAALLMASLQALVRSHAPYYRESLAKMFVELNRLLFSLTDDSKFASFFCGIWDSTQSTLTYVNAGHNPPLFLSESYSPPVGVVRSTRVEDTYLLRPNGLVLGLFEQASYVEGRIHFSPGDALVIYTDGVTEAANSKGDEFGENRLEKLASENRHLPANALKDLLVQETIGFSKPGEMHDDSTVVVLRHTG
jgi:sigma-B regulation protein RsbU (phosphoserine phosphatase)